MRKIILLSLFVICSCTKKDPAPTAIADFSFSADSPFAPVKITFTNKSTNQVTNFWDFGDGSVSADLNPTHTYTTSKIYAVTLKVTNSENVTSSITKTITVLNPLPIADFSFSADNTFAPLKITFTNKSTNQTASVWDFGDGTTSTDASPSHVFTTGKVFTITLKTTNADNATSIITKTVTVLNAPTKMKLNSVVLTSMSFTAPGAGGWDSGNVKGDFGYWPDVYFRIRTVANAPTLLMTEITYDLTGSSIPLTISSNLPVTLQEVDYYYTFGVYDYDVGFLPDIIAEFSFKMKDYMPNDGSVYPSKIEISRANITLTLNVEWLP